MNTLPASLEKYFWDCDFSELDMDQHNRFIIERILNFGDDEAIRWLQGHVDKNLIQDVVNHSRNLSEKTRNFWQIIARDTVHGALNGVKISFLRYEYKLLQPLHSLYDVKIADVLDIALMKLSAISARGAKKDFIDMYFLLQRFSLQELFAAYRQKYGEGMDSEYHLLKSLVYFQDAEHEPMPRMIEKVSWLDIKRFMIDKVGKKFDRITG